MFIKSIFFKAGETIMQRSASVTHRQTTSGSLRIVSKFILANKSFNKLETLSQRFSLAMES